MSTAIRIQDAATPSTPPVVRCLACHRPATVHICADALRFSAVRCDPCGALVLNWAALRGADVTLSRVVGTSTLTHVAGVEIAPFAVAVLDGLVGDEPVPAFANVPQAKELVVRALEGRLRRTLMPSERLAVEVAAADEACRRYHERRANLLDTERRLHMPFGMGAR